MKKTVWLLLICVMFTASCQKNTDDPAQVSPKQQAEQYTASQYDILNSRERLILPLQDGFVNTTIEKRSDVTPYKTPEAVDYFVTVPAFCVAEETGYLIRNFPADLADGAESYMRFIDEREPALPVEIEIYDDLSHTDVSRRIVLKDLAERNPIFGSLTVNDDGTFSLVGREINKNGALLQYLYHLNSEGEIITEGEFRLTMDDTYFAKDEAVYVLEKGGLGGINPLILRRSDISSGQETIISDKAFCMVLQDSVLYYLTREQNENFEYFQQLCMYDISSQTTEILGEVKIDRISLSERIQSMAYDRDSNILYLGGFHTLISYAMESGETATMLESDDTVEVKMISGNNLVLGIGLNQLSVYSLRPEENTSVDDGKIVLNVCLDNSEPGLFSTAYRKVLKAMEVSGISVRIHEAYVTDNPQEYSNTMAKKLLAGDKDFDLYIVDTSMTNLLREEYCWNLQAYPLLETYYDLLLPGVKDLCEIDGIAAMVPQNFATLMLEKKCEAEFPDHFGEIVEWVNSTEFGEGKVGLTEKNVRLLLTPWLKQLTSNFMAERTDNQTACADMEFFWRSAMKLADSKNVYIGQDTFDAAVDYTWIQSGGHNHEHETELYEIPKINSDYGNTVTGSFLAVNPNAENKELAAVFLAYMMEIDAQDIGQGRNLYETNIDSDGTLSAKVFKDSVREYWNMEIIEFFDQLIVQLINGEIDTAQAASDTYRYLRMIRDE